VGIAETNPCTEKSMSVDKAHHFGIGGDDRLRQGLQAVNHGSAV